MPKKKVQPDLTSVAATGTTDADVSKAAGTLVSATATTVITPGLTTVVTPVVTPTPVALGVNQRVTTTVPQLVVAGEQPGTYTFELVVQDDIGGISQPVQYRVQVQQPVIG